MWDALQYVWPPGVAVQLRYTCEMTLCVLTLDIDSGTTHMCWLLSLWWHQGHSKERPLFTSIQNVTLEGPCCYILPGGLIAHRPQLCLAVVARSVINPAQPVEAQQYNPIADAW